MPVDGIVAPRRGGAPPDDPQSNYDGIVVPKRHTLTMHGVISDADGSVVVNLFQTDADTDGWQTPGPAPPIPPAQLPHP
jgi:hypothetical protein